MQALVDTLWSQVIAPAEARALHGPGALHIKADGSRVTAADLDIEAILATGLARVFPDDGLQAEEGTVRAGAAWWAVDPIDGTENYLRGSPDWSIALCRVVDQRPQLCALSFPARRERWWAAVGAGAWRDHQRVPLRSGGPLAPWTLGANPRGGAHVQLVHAPLLLPASVLRHVQARWPGPVEAPRCTTRAMARVVEGSAAAALVGPGWQSWDVFGGLVLLGEVGLGAWTLDGRLLVPTDPAIDDERPPFVVGEAAAAAALARALHDAT